MNKEIFRRDAHIHTYIIYTYHIHIPTYIINIVYIEKCIMKNFKHTKVETIV